ncbi:MAG: 50S ribosomal protein L18 [Magnetococcales bacterium]|nr:50S ribosomal protein L18 [Magnetococcales bacterium]MBF0149949.1 50S ribosomal protein L18 [Magnetococcales bacterium]MBF0172882.1 50S ribosomal protein L18 [Magnetococcales bacterium]MBF0346723.1 50S ribosomal protein L18 [Magnetococcales bacterium]MBF0630395.1 50S ribosomal protein L18 [Magnetococcales bacterium]
MAKDRHQARWKRGRRIRNRIKHVRKDRLRLSVFRSATNIYAQIIDDAKGETLVSASTLEKEIREGLKSSGNIEAAAAVGKALAGKAIQASIKQVVFDRGGYLYHGRVKALADAAREAGLEF